MNAPGKLLYDLLLAAPAVVALAGNRIYPVRLAQGAALPAIAYQLISDAPTGAARGCVLPGAPRVQISLFARAYEDLEALDAAVRGALDGAETPAYRLHFLNGFDQFEDASTVFYRPTDYRVDYL